MIRHQAPGKNLDSKTLSLVPQGLDIFLTVSIITKDWDGSHAPLGQVMGVTWNDCAGNSCHTRDVTASYESLSTNKYYVPRLTLVDFCSLFDYNALITIEGGLHAIDRENA